MLDRSAGQQIWSALMPFVRMTVSGPPLAAEQISLLHTGMTELMAAILNKRADLTSVLVEQPAITGWAIGGKPVNVAAHVDATITAGTNSPEQKARFIEETMRLLKRVVGADLHPATYVLVSEVPADSWGYDGRSQESRKESRKESRPLAV